MAVITIPGVGKVSTTTGKVVTPTATVTKTPTVTTTPITTTVAKTPVATTPTVATKTATSTTPTLTAEQELQIAALKKAYAAAQATGDTAAMKAANTSANAIRSDAGLVAGVNYNATTGATITPAQSTTTTQAVATTPAKTTPTVTPTYTPSAAINNTITATAPKVQSTVTSPSVVTPIATPVVKPTPVVSTPAQSTTSVQAVTTTPAKTTTSAVTPIATTPTVAEKVISVPGVGNISVGANSSNGAVVGKPATAVTPVTLTATQEAEAEKIRKELAAKALADAQAAAFKKAVEDAQAKAKADEEARLAEVAKVKKELEAKAIAEKEAADKKAKADAEALAKKQAKELADKQAADKAKAEEDARIKALADAKAKAEKLAAEQAKVIPTAEKIISVPGVGNISVGANTSNGSIVEKPATPIVPVTITQQPTTNTTPTTQGGSNVATIPTWQQKLETYKTDANAAAAEIARAKEVYAQKQAAGDTAGMAAANQWANQIRTAQGLVAGKDYNPTTGGTPTANNANVISVPGTPTGYINANGGVVTPDKGAYVMNSPVTETNKPNATTPVTSTTIANPSILPATNPNSPDYAAYTKQLESLTQAVTNAQSQNQLANSNIQSLYDAQRKAQLAALENAKNQALSNLSAEQSKIAPQFYDKRNQTAASNQQQARNFAEFMAARGMTGAGANAQAEISRQGVYQSNLGALNQQELAAQSDIARRESDVNNGYLTDMNAANAQIDAQLQQALIDQSNQDRSYNLQLGTLLGNINGQPTLAAQAQAYNQSPNNPDNQAQVLANKINAAKASTANQTAQLELQQLQNQVKAGTIDAATAQAKYNNIATQIAYENQLAAAKVSTQNAATTKNNAQASAASASANLSAAKTNAVNNPTVKTTPTKTTKPTINQYTASHVSNLDQIKAAYKDAATEKKVITKYLTDNKSLIIEQIGQTAYNKLKNQYGIYN